MTRMVNVSRRVIAPILLRNKAYAPEKTTGNIQENGKKQTSKTENNARLKKAITEIDIPIKKSQHATGGDAGPTKKSGQLPTPTADEGQTFPKI